MTGKNINFDNKNIKKGDFYNKNKKIFNIDDIDANINKILVSKKEQYGRYINKFDKNKITIKSYNKIWKKLKN